MDDELTRRVQGLCDACDRDWSIAAVSILLELILLVTFLVQRQEK